MGRTPLPERFNLKLMTVDREGLKALAEHYRLDESATLRFLIGKECRALGIGGPSPAPVKKKRRAAPG
jgi:hypothetical protein